MHLWKTLIITLGLPISLAIPIKNLSPSLSMSCGQFLYLSFKILTFDQTWSIELHRRKIEER